MKDADYKGYEWGYLKADGKREAIGTDTVIQVKDIIGVWGRLFRKEIQRPYYRETFLSELPDQNCASPLSSLQSLNLQQCLTFAYPESKPIDSEVLTFNAEEKVETKLIQMWKCPCGHTFYTDVKRRTIKQLFKGMFARARCGACGKFNAVRAGKVRKKVCENS